MRNLPTLDKNKKHDIEAVVDRLILKGNLRVRLADSVETALKIGEGLICVMVQEPGDDGERLDGCDLQREVRLPGAPGGVAGGAVAATVQLQ